MEFDTCGCEFFANVFCYALIITSTMKLEPKLLQYVDISFNSPPDRR